MHPVVSITSRRSPTNTPSCSTHSASLGRIEPQRARSLFRFVDLNQVLHALYDRAAYDLRINYRAAPEPALNEEDAAWADALLRKAGLRCSRMNDRTYAMPGLVVANDTSRSEEYALFCAVQRHVIPRCARGVMALRCGRTMIT
ncbi:DUF4058 family protein [Candidatus Gracilibacteria bacterium]|nr:DUF4058 family protein [Candidatus Gracilibacteria bacterium]